MKSFFKQISILIIFLIIVLFLLTTYSGKNGAKTGLWSKDFEQQLELGNIKSVEILKLPEGQYKFKARFKERVEGQSGMEFETDRYPDEWKERLTEQGIASDAKTESMVLTSLLINILPIILIIGVFWYFRFRHMQGRVRGANVGSVVIPVTFKEEVVTESPARTLDEFEIGKTFALPSRTMTEAHFAAFQMLSGDNHPIHYDLEYCKRLGHEGMLAHGFQVLAFSAAGAGSFPHLLGENLIGFIEQSCRFLKPVYPGDTLYPSLKVSDLKRQNTTGVITLLSAIHNQKKELVLEGEQKYLVRL